MCYQAPGSASACQVHLATVRFEATFLAPEPRLIKAVFDYGWVSNSQSRLQMNPLGTSKSKGSLNAILSNRAAS